MLRYSSHLAAGGRDLRCELAKCFESRVRRFEGDRVAVDRDGRDAIDQSLSYALLNLADLILRY